MDRGRHRHVATPSYRPQPGLFGPAGALYLVRDTCVLIFC
ncbi:hypothetical protein BQ8420_10525 [Nocardiopsis sp. JB363]|nr:hypothetical protein BQ8420_10525 [Nocardiopsis sp. JB363]